MRIIILVSTILLATLAPACKPTPSASGKYKEKMAADKKAAESGDLGPPGSDSLEEGGEEGSEEGGQAEGTGTAAGGSSTGTAGGVGAGGSSTGTAGGVGAGGSSTAGAGTASTGTAATGSGGVGKGDPTKGAALLSPCLGCHDGDKGLGAKVKLDKTAITRLDAAYTGTQKGYHGSFKDQFVTSRADVEAALAAK